MLGYEAVKEYAASVGRRISDLIVLSPQNDPFYCGSPAHRKQAEWFRRMWELLNPPTGIHLRRLHYLLISQATPVLGPDGAPYLNTEACWNLISEASKKARYLDLVPVEAFTDRRNPPIVSYATVPQPENCYVTSGSMPHLPLVISEPGLRLEAPAAHQRYHIEVWCEKSTINDVLEPLCSRYQATLVTGVGEMSATRSYELAQRAIEGRRPVRIFYISDFDPAGQSMPVAASRKIEFFIRKAGSDADVKLWSIALTAEQCREYRLPRTPIKETEARRHGFERRHGEGATELDALEALHPGVLREIVDAEMSRYYDDDLARNLEWRRREHQRELDAEASAVRKGHRAEIDEILAENRRLKSELEGFQARCGAVWQAIEEKLDDLTCSKFHWPEPAFADEKPDALFDSTRDLLDQIEHYKSFQGKAVAIEDAA